MGNAFTGVQRRQVSQDKRTVSKDLLREVGPEEALEGGVGARETERREGWQMCAGYKGRGRLGDQARPAWVACTAAVRSELKKMGLCHTSGHLHCKPTNNASSFCREHLWIPNTQHVPGS